MRKNWALWLWLIFFPIAGQGQDMGRAKTVIDTLCSPGYYGRGYTFSGDQSAAEFLVKHFDSAGLKPLNGDSFFQYFPINVNTFPEAPELCIGKRKLDCGKDYLPDASSGSFKGKGYLLSLDTLVFTNNASQKAFLETDISDKFLVLDQGHEQLLFQLPRDILIKAFSAKGHVILVDKLTHSLSPNQYKLPRIKILREKLKKNKKQLSLGLTAERLEGYRSANVLGMIEGHAQPDSFIVFTAHYDHIGSIGKDVVFYGGNDNASGTAMLVELAYHYMSNPPPYSILFMAFSGEEAGLIGSKFYTENPILPLSKIRFLINIDLFATGEDGLMAVNGSVHKEEFALLKEINADGEFLSYIGARGKAANSDHYFFSEKGVPSFFFYLMGDWQNYHDIYDRPPLPLSRFQESFQLIKGFADALQE